MNDTVLRIFAKEAGLRGLLGRTTELAREGARRHHASPVAAAALSDALTAAALLGALLKVQQRVGLKAEGDGPLRKLVTESDAYGRVRGYVAEPDVSWPLPITTTAAAAALGHTGLLTVVQEVGLRRDLHQGAVALHGDSFEDSLSHYFVKSEQTPTLVKVALATDDAGNLATAGGLLFQPLPGAKASALQQVVRNLAALPPLAELLATEPDLEKIVARVLQGIEYTIVEQRPVAFSCSCSRARSRQALKVLSEDDLLGLIVEGEAVVDCHFCHERYVFDREELGQILDELESDALNAMFDEPGYAETSQQDPT